MKLFWTPASPFVRKVMVAAIELGMLDRIEIVPTYWPHEWATRTIDFDKNFIDANPIGRIPTLVTDDGIAIPESNWICCHLDSLADRPRLFPRDGTRRWELVRLLAIADGAIEAMIARRAESLRLAPEQSKDFVGKQRDRIVRCLDQVERSVALLEGELHMAQISAGVGCGYMDFRFPQDAWRTGRSNLAAWYERFSQRKSMLATTPAETPQQAPERTPHPISG